MVLKSLRPFLLHQIWDMPLCLCISRKTNDGMMDRGRDGGSESGVCIMCERPQPTRWGVISYLPARNHRQGEMTWSQRRMEPYVLVEHKVRGKVKHPAVDVLVGPPSQGKHHHSHPRMLDDGHLVVHVEVSETWVAWILLSEHLSHYCSAFAPPKTFIQPAANNLFRVSVVEFFLHLKFQLISR